MNLIKSKLNCGRLICFLMLFVIVLLVVFRKSLFGTAEEEGIPDVAVVKDYTYLPPVPVDTLPTVDSEPESEPTPASYADFQAFSEKENLNFCLYEENSHQSMYNLVNTSDIGFNLSTEGIDSVADIKNRTGKKKLMNLVT